MDHLFENGIRWIEVAPPDGTAKLALVEAKPESEEYKLIGRFSQTFFLTEDVVGVYQAWCKRGVRFHFPPKNPEWGGMFTRFEDADGNSFGLAGVDEARREIEARRRAIAEKLESERRAAQELEIAKQVQARLFPQTLPPCRTLDYAGTCIQARQVGGDYYDFLDLGKERLGLIIGDISGKGIAGALERLESTATVLGLFKDWDCSLQSCRLSAGDMFAIYTDGVTEAFDDRGEEFGEERLIEALRRYREQPSGTMLESIVGDIQRFSSDEQADDITVIVAKCRGG